MIAPASTLKRVIPGWAHLLAASLVMANNEFDRDRARGALEVVRQHPGMVLFAASPALIAVAAVWLLASPGWAILLALVLLVGGGVAVLRKR